MISKVSKRERKLNQANSLCQQALSQVTSTGAMTYSFIRAIEGGHATTYGSMLNAMRSTIRNTGDELEGGLVTSLITMLLNGGNLSTRLRQVCYTTAASAVSL